MVAVLLVAAVAGCSDSPLEQAADDLEAARERWLASGASSYRYNVRLSCFCGPEALRAVTVTVANGVTVSALYADSGTVADTTQLRGLLTVEQLFARVAETIEGRPDELAVQFDATLGYLTSFQVDQDFAMADEEYSITVTEFQPQP